MKYLRVILDAKLMQRRNAKQRTIKDSFLFLLYRRTLGRTWGLKRKIVH
jgi:hypothetical protein